MAILNSYDRHSIKAKVSIYSSTLAGPVIYGLSPNAVLCVNYLPTILLKLAAIGIFILVATEYAGSYFNTENDLLSAFEDYSQIYSVEADEIKITWLNDEYTPGLFDHISSILTGAFFHRNCYGEFSAYLEV